ncbi:RcnB family protein [Pseudoxanthomonas wuyuanensis]
MKRLLIASALMMAVSSIASADERWQDQREYEKDRSEAMREAGKDRREAEREYWKDRREAQREYEKDRREAMKERAKAERRWARGEYIPQHYLADPYYVRDYRAYDLAPPPPGYGWVRPDPRDDEYYMVQLATGVIAQMLDR